MKLSEIAINEREIYYIGAATGFLCIVRGVSLKKHLKIWNRELRKGHRKQFDRIVGTLKAIAFKGNRKNAEEAISNLSDFMGAMDKWKKLEDREVKERYTRLGKGVVIVIEGDEVGKFWDKDEYDRWWKKQNEGFWEEAIGRT